jgi:hypothetical protein
MSKFFPSSSLERRTERFQLQVSRGQIAGHRAIQVFGYNADLDQTEESIWPDGGTVPHPTVASVLKVSSTSASDAAVGVGARTVFIEGVDGDYNVVSESVTLNGTTPVNTTNTYLYVNQLYVTSVGSTGANVGVINVGTGDVTAGVPAVLYDLIAAGYNQRTTSHYCVPAGCTGFMTHGLVTVGQASGSTSVTAYLKQHGPDGILRVGAVTTLNNGSVDYNFEYPYVIPEKNCVGATAVGSANNNMATAFFNIVLVDGAAVGSPGTPWN